MKCRHCHNVLDQVFLDLGFAPPSNAYLSSAELRQPELYFPLKVYVCEHCWLVQTEDFARAAELFSPDYAYFSSVSDSWLEHAARYVSMIRERLGLGFDSFVVEIAANDGYLLKNFVTTGIPCLGIEPTDGTATAAEALDVPILRAFFGQSVGQQLAAEGRQADLIIGNNVYAHVPDINDFTAGLKAALKPEGTITLEFPHLLQLIRHTQFDTIYHEHFSYLSLTTVTRIFESADLRVFDLEALSTHGGSLRVYGCHVDDSRDTAAAVAGMLEIEQREGLHDLATYGSFQSRADQVKNDFLSFLIEQKRAGKSVVAYGAAAKGNTLLNYAGVKPDLIPFVYDAAASKQGKFLPGSHIPILPPDELRRQKPDWIFILPWNIASEIVAQINYIHDWGGRFLVAVPKLGEVK